jgi:putative Mn2+ efflux pump MntP
MIGLIKTILIIIGLWVVIQFFSRLMATTPRQSTNSSHRKNDNNKDDGEYIEYEEIK